MPGMRCTVVVCNNSRLNAKKSNKDVRFYRFPKDENLRDIWVQKCKRLGKWNPESCRVCSEHFKEEDFEHDLQAELLNLPPKRKLKDTAIPSLNLTKNPSSSDSKIKDNRRKSLAKRHNKLLMQDTTTASNSQTREENINQSLLKKYNSLLADNEMVKTELKNMKEQNDNLKLKIKALENNWRNLISKLEAGESWDS